MATEGTVILDFMIESEANVFPMIPSGQTIKQMIEGQPE
jgi:thiamine pyrophosphate-dependent acetolactate synthase large subunit-like protein